MELETPSWANEILACRVIAAGRRIASAADKAEVHRAIRIYRTFPPIGAAREAKVGTSVTRHLVFEGFILSSLGGCPWIVGYPIGSWNDF